MSSLEACEWIRETTSDGPPLLSGCHGTNLGTGFYLGLLTWFWAHYKWNQICIDAMWAVLRVKSDIHNCVGWWDRLQGLRRGSRSLWATSRIYSRKVTAGTSVWTSMVCVVSSRTRQIWSLVHLLSYFYFMQYLTASIWVNGIFYVGLTRMTQFEKEEF